MAILDSRIEITQCIHKWEPTSGWLIWWFSHNELWRRDVGCHLCKRLEAYQRDMLPYWYGDSRITSYGDSRFENRDNERAMLALIYVCDDSHLCMRLEPYQRARYARIENRHSSLCGNRHFNEPCWVSFMYAMALIYVCDSRITVCCSVLHFNAVCFRVLRCKTMCWLSFMYAILA